MLGITDRVFEELGVAYDRLAGRKVSDKDLMAFASRLIPDNPTAESNSRTTAIRQILNKVVKETPRQPHRSTITTIAKAAGCDLLVDPKNEELLLKPARRIPTSAMTLKRCSKTCGM